MAILTGKNGRNGNGNGNGSLSPAQGTSIWISLAGALVAAVGYAWYLAASQGTMQAGQIENERRIANIEQNGSPHIGAMKSTIDNNLRSNIEMQKQLQVLVNNDAAQRQEEAKAAVALADVQRRIAVLEAGSIPPVSDRLSDLKAATTAHDQQLKVLTDEQLRLRDADERRRELYAQFQLAVSARLSILEADHRILNRDAH